MRTTLASQGVIGCKECCNQHFEAMVCVVSSNQTRVCAHLQFCNLKATVVEALRYAKLFMVSGFIVCMSLEMSNAFRAMKITCFQISKCVRHFSIFFCSQNVVAKYRREMQELTKFRFITRSQAPVCRRARLVVALKKAHPMEE